MNLICILFLNIILMIKLFEANFSFFDFQGYFDCLTMLFIFIFIFLNKNIKLFLSSPINHE